MNLFDYNRQIIDTLSDEPDELWEEEFAERAPELPVTLLTVAEQREEIAKRWDRNGRAEDEITDAIATMGRQDFARFRAAHKDGDLLELGRIVDGALRSYWRASQDEGF